MIKESCSIAGGDKKCDVCRCYNEQNIVNCDYMHILFSNIFYVHEERTTGKQIRLQRLPKKCKNVKTNHDNKWT